MNDFHTLYESYENYLREHSFHRRFYIEDGTFDEHCRNMIQAAKRIFGVGEK